MWCLFSVVWSFRSVFSVEYLLEFYSVVYFQLYSGIGKWSWSVSSRVTCLCCYTVNFRQSNKSTIIRTVIDWSAELRLYSRSTCFTWDMYEARCKDDHDCFRVFAVLTHQSVLCTRSAVFIYSHGAN